MDRKKRGFLAEDYAAKLIESRGYKIIARNFTTSFSEIDIIALKDNTVIFVEVKARWGTKFGKPEEAVGAKKLFRIKKASELFYIKNPKMPKKSRIEVVSLIVEKDVVKSEKIIKVY